jgi:uncharacterized NAD(P)/FAD-binding protein YdhS
MSGIEFPKDNHRGLAWLVTELDAHQGVLVQSRVRRLLTEANLDYSEVAPYIEHCAERCARRSVVRRENYEILVVTWAPFQGCTAHDHSGCLCGLKVVQGSLVEQLYAGGNDGNVRAIVSSRLGPGEITVDPGVVVHSLANTGPIGEVVTVHVYSPPLPEIRKFVVSENPPSELFLRLAPDNAEIIAIVGGGFTGVMTMAHLLRLGNDRIKPMHIVLIDQQAAIGEGVAYRTADAKHLLNVPAGHMSAWPDRPDDFLIFARSKDSTVNSTDFLPRRLYGQYVREILFAQADAARQHLSAEVLRDLVICMETSTSSSGWKLQTKAGKSIHAQIAILATGHRPPNDPFLERWTGPRTRFIIDPWTTLALTQIGPNEPVLLLGSGLTAVDVMLTLNRPDRVAPIIVLSRHGLMPMAHLRRNDAAPDLSDLVEQWLDPRQVVTVCRLVRTLRKSITSAERGGIKWQQVIDAIRHVIPRIWARLDTAERSRFLRHLRPFWEVHRHRMAPSIADIIDRLRQARIVEVIAGTLVAANADADGIDITICCRSVTTERTERVAWIVNCTGPGVHSHNNMHSFLRPLLAAGTLRNDDFNLGLITDEAGRALAADGHVHRSLLVAGTLRKSTLWESTAVSELRQQAQAVARTALEY